MYRSSSPDSVHHLPLPFTCRLRSLYVTVLIAKRKPPHHNINTHTHFQSKTLPPRHSSHPFFSSSSLLRSAKCQPTMKRCVLVALFAFCCVLVDARFVVEKSSITVLSPHKLRAKRDGAIGNFGLPDYGGFIVGSVVYPDKNSHACQVFDGDKPFKFRSNRPTILLLDRGECYFALKVWHAQVAGAAAVLVTDSIDESLITMDSPEESSDADGYIEKIVIPSALIEKSFGDMLKEALNNKDEVLLRIDWRESVPHPDNRVEYEFWTNSNDECGARCDEQMNFVKNFKGHAQILERGGYTLFTPHYITWFCPPPFILSSQCKSQCINHGRYCAPDPEKDFGEGYEGKDVVFENLRQLCVHRVANESNRSWVWWDYVTDFHVRCSMKEKRYSKDCAEELNLNTTDLPLEKIKKCMGDPDADAENEVLKNEQQVQDTFRGRVCECPIVNGVQYKGDGYTTCEAFGPARCSINHGGCWSETRKGVTFSACSDSKVNGCECPVGFHGDGNECEERSGSRFGRFLAFVVIAVVVGAGLAGYVFYKYRLRSYMDSEIMAIMSQYMPLDQQNNVVHAETQPLRQGTV
ncbi:hypothetical protein Fmac_008080 [Flemingia macrophylla]|uniref:PA domain-containing protein n=1 Tax=Flemingia macrophylla TaxID=520843 RepID=A0ABD1MWD4_9FABA